MMDGSEPMQRWKRWIATWAPAFLILALAIGIVAWREGRDGAFSLAIFEEEKPPVILRVPLPTEVRGLYWTAQTAGTPRADQLLEYMRETGLNAVVIDLKNDGGAIGFNVQDPALEPYQMNEPYVNDLDALLKRLGEVGIYRVARLTVMKDNVFAEAHPDLALRTRKGNLWQDNIGGLWIDPAAPALADYALALAREAYARGFDEIQFDYVRFPSDGILSNIVYPVYDGTKTEVEVMQEFWKKLGVLRDEGIPVSHDLFGMTFWRTEDFGIGQRLADVYLYADFISPMVYPSHYPNGFEGYGNPAVYPYEIVNKSLNEGAKLLEQETQIPPEESRKKFRPWLQDFDLGATYTAAMIEAQIKAARDAGASGWMLWNARNIYEPARYTTESSP
jgi:hypothetical protein